ncbi:MAG TPA: GAF domain-containing protein, partial [Candidatus Limnocylindrales bacterium]|nr:GAF domain-containing protein [Candidatus Limnocylindrales bacterium]
MPPPVSRTPRPGDATLSVTKAARVLGVHPNTVRAWSEAGRLRYYRINDRGDRRYRLNDLQRFLAAAESGITVPPPDSAPATRAAARREMQAPGVATLSESPAGLDLLADLAEVASFPSGLDPALDEACRRIRLATGAALVGIWEQRPGGLVPRATDVEGPGITAARAAIPTRSLFTLALESDQPIHARPGTSGPAPVLGMGTDELVVRIPGGEEPWGILVLAGAMQLGPDDGVRLAHAIARTLGVLIRGASATEQATGRLRRSEALRRVATDLASRLDVGDVVRDLSDHARVLFGADRVAVVLRDPEGRVSTPGGTGFSEAFLAVARELEEARASSRDIPARRPLLLLGPDAPRSGSPLRAAAVQEGVDTLLVAPLVDGHELHGVLYLAHDRPHRWREVDLDGAEALAGDAAIAVRSARTFGRMAAWAAQLQSIQRLGARLSGLTDVAAIGHAIATELRQLIDYQNARVYRVKDTDLVPVAMQGSGGVYGDETVDSLTVAIGEGITGWVARFRVPQLVDDTANDPRAITIPGTEEDLDESMLLAPMVHEGSCLGVVVLSRLGLRQFTEDDLRLLVIYASFAAQAMANADATERLRRQSSALERQLAAQQALLKTTESILTTLDQRQLLEQITDRLGSLIQCDNIAIEVVERPSGLLRPLTARGIHADEYMAPWEPGETGIATWVVDHNEPVLIDDEASDERVNHFRDTGRLDGSLIVVPLLGPHGAAGVLTLERIGQEQPFDEQEFDLVKLFAAQVSIALRNAEIYHEAELRAKTDDLTTLLNHGTFKDRLSRSVSANDPFGLVMIDLDEFKTVNDTLGHTVGDDLLVAVGERIAETLPPTALAARFGGDEFAVLLSGPDAATAEGIGDLVSASVLEPTRAGTRELTVHVSIGVATAGPEDDADELLRKADVAMYAAKAAGRMQVKVYDPALDEEVIRRHELLADLEHAIKRREFVAHYQPIVDLATNQTVAVEALVRWNSPTRGLVPPGLFIEAAEEA